MNDDARLRVVYDATPLALGHVNTRARTGIYRVCERIVAGASANPRLAVHLSAFTGLAQSCHAAAFARAAGGAWSDRYRHAWRVPLVPQVVTDAVHAPEAGRLRHYAQRALHRVARMRLPGTYDVVHSIYDPLPPRDRVAARSRVLTVHDMCPTLFPNLFQEQTNQHFALIMASIDHARDRVVCVSEATRRDFLAATGMAADRVEAIPLAADPAFCPPGDPLAVRNLRARLGLGDAPYLACLSALGPRKNLAFLLRALAAAVRRGRLGNLQVVLAGPPAAGADDIREAAADEVLRGRIHFPGFLDDADLPAFFAGAVAMVYPSLYEGFGLPPLEAMACGTPTICSRTSSLPEVVGDGGILIDPTDERDLTAAIEAIVSRPDLRADLAARALRQAARFSWRRCVERHVDLYRRAASADPA